MAPGNLLAAALLALLACAVQGQQCAWTEVKGPCSVSCAGGVRSITWACSCGNATLCLALVGPSPANSMEACNEYDCPVCSQIFLDRVPPAAGVPANAILGTYAKLANSQIAGRSVFVNQAQSVALFFYAVSNAWVVGPDPNNPDINTLVAINSQNVPVADLLTSGWSLVVGAPGSQTLQGDSNIVLSCTGCEPPYYYDEVAESCAICHESCLGCAGPRIDQCSSCPAGKTLVAGWCFEPLTMILNAIATAFPQQIFRTTLAGALQSYFPDATLNVSITSVVPSEDGFTSIVNITVCYPDWCQSAADVKDALLDEERRQLIQNLLGYTYTFPDEVTSEESKGKTILQKMIPVMAVCGGVVLIVLCVVFYQCMCTSKEDTMKMVPVDEEVFIGYQPNNIGEEIAMNITHNTPPQPEQRPANYFFMRFLRQQGSAAPNQ